VIRRTSYLRKTGPEQAVSAGRIFVRHHNASTCLAGLHFNTTNENPGAHRASLAAMVFLRYASTQNRPFRSLG
jgi:hypothetical protein